MRRFGSTSWISLVLATMLFPPVHSGLATRPERSARSPGTQALLLSVPKARNGLILQPGASKKLKVKVTDASGRPRGGVSLLFVAPETGPSGTFASSTVTRVTSNAKGIGSAVFKAGDAPGVFLVSVLVEPAETDVRLVSATFGITIRASGATPALAADRARLAVKQQVMSDAVEDGTISLHGPVLVEAGATLAPAGTSLLETAPLPITKQSWLFWIDDVPGGEFVHPTRFVLVDANDTTPTLETEAIVVHEFWWPVVTLPGAPPRGLLPPADTNASVPASAVVESHRALAEAPAPDEDACAIVIYGPSETGKMRDGAKMVDFFKNTLKIPDAQIFTSGEVRTPPVTKDPPATPTDVRALFEAAARLRCPKIYLYIATHGYGSGVCLGNENSGDNSTEYDYMEFTEIARLLEPFGTTGTQVCVMVQACSAGGMVGALQGHGYSGGVVTACDTGSVTCSFPGPFGFGFFTRALLKCWQDPAADSDDPGATVDLLEAGEWVKRNVSVITDGQASNPNVQISMIAPTGLRYPLPDLLIPSATDPTMNMKTLRIERPIGVTGDLVCSLTIEDPSVAAFDGESPGAGVVLRDGQSSATLTIKGLRDGSTTYSISCRETVNNRVRTGMAIIQVGSGYSVTPNPVIVKVGATASVSLKRTGLLRHYPGTVIFSTMSADESVARPDVIPVPRMSPGVDETTIAVIGVAVGTTTIKVRDIWHGLETSFAVQVVADVCMLETGTYECVASVDMDNCGHDPFVNIDGFQLMIAPDGGMFLISGSNPQMCEGQGPLDTELCSVTTAECMATVAGFQNVRCQWREVMTVSSGDPKTGTTTTVEGKLAMGVGGELPGGCPIVYRFTGTLQRKAP